MCAIFAAAADGGANTGTAASAKDDIGGSKPSPKQAAPVVGGDLSLTEALAKLTDRDAQEVETRTQRHRKFLTSGVVPQVAAGLVAAAKVRPADPLEFLAAYLIRYKSFFANWVSFLAGVQQHCSYPVKDPDRSIIVYIIVVLSTVLYGVGMPYKLYHAARASCNPLRWKFGYSVNYTLRQQPGFA